MRRFVATMLTLALGVSAAVPQASNSSSSLSEPSTSTPHSIATRLDGHGIPKFAKVNEHLYRGGQPNAEGLEQLRSMGMDVVIDLRGSASESEEAAVNKLGMQYISLPSHCPFPSDRPWAQFLRVMRENRDKKVFVHCRLGDDRTGLAVAAYRMSEEGWPAKDALNEMKEFGFTGIHHVICLGMSGYVKGFPTRLKKDEAFRELR